MKFHSKKWKGFILPVIAGFGFVLALLSVIKMEPSSEKMRPPIKPVETPKLKSNQNLFLSGKGIVESISEDINIATSVSGVVSQVFVKVGQQVKKGEPLLKTQSSKAHSDYLVRLSELEVAKSRLKESESRRDFYRNIKDKEAVSQEEVRARELATETAAAQVKQAEARVLEAKAKLNLHTVKAPIDAEVLRINVHPGEFAQAGESARPLIVIGDTSALNVRVDVDEYEIRALGKSPTATIMPKGNANAKYTGELVKTELLVVPKHNLTGVGQELVDTRVLQLIFRVKQKNPSLYVGQQVDVFIMSQTSPMGSGKMHDA